MPPTVLSVKGEQFAIIPMKEYRALKKSSQSKSASKKPRTARMTAQDRGDVAESKRRLAEPGRRVTHKELMRELGL